MDVSYLLDGLNDRQRQAVSAQDQDLLVLAGAGSGKTRVLVHRIAWLIQVMQHSPLSILAVTFTNKAAAEMRGRVEKVLGRNVQQMWIGTFHGLAHRLLRAHYQDAGLPQNFQILDSDDQQRLLKRTIKALNLDEKQWPAKQAAWYINAKKDDGLRPQHIDTFDPTEQTQLQIYTAYQAACDRAGIVDFAELLLRVHELLRDNKHVREHYQRRFRHILVDEFQDTNRIQYAWIRMLAGQQNHVMIVGDDDQSIYGWRGAQVENLQHFLRDFPRADTIRLEQNYRSTGTILKAANQVIGNNADRMGKDLWTDGNDGEAISLYAAFNEQEEARYIVSQIKRWQEQGGALSDVAILYRNNAQSRVLEEGLLYANLAYRIYGGLRFFDRQEIKDAVAYLRLVSSRQDDAAFERVVNTPTRGIGERTLGLLREMARSEQVTMWDAAQKMVTDGLLSGRAKTAVAGFLSLINDLEDACFEKPLSLQADAVMKRSGLLAMYQAEQSDKAETRVENLQELVSATETFVPTGAEGMSPLAEFLAHAALESGEEQADAYQDAVQLMTLHSAKGLEFPLVFMTGMEEGTFPSQMSAGESGRLEEERRLCYVGMTRAMEKLILTYAESRRLYGQENFHTPSRFIAEIPAEYIDEVRVQARVQQPMQQRSRFHTGASHEAFSETGFRLGQRVAHQVFGEGTVLNYEGSGAQSRIQVNFDVAGSKWLMVSYAKLTPLG